MIYPWQDTEWQRLKKMSADGRLPHAFMFVGIKGIGKAHLADQFAQYLFCQQAKEQACGKCHACRMLIGRVHPNVLWVAPEKEGAAIKVDQVRAVNEFISQSAMQGEHKIAIINPANQMNVNAANALLKTLEEPSKGAIIILLCDQLGRLPATIISRCHRFTFHRPQTALAEEWLTGQLGGVELPPALLLSLANGAPLTALSLIERDVIALRKKLFDSIFALLKGQADPLKLAAEMQSEDFIILADFISSLLQDVLKIELASGHQLTHTDYHAQLASVPANFSDRAPTLLSKLQHLRASCMSGIHLNQQLMLESLFIEFVNCQEVAA